jgi:hypothetical protein
MIPDSGETLLLLGQTFGKPEEAAFVLQGMFHIGEGILFDLEGPFPKSDELILRLERTPLNSEGTSLRR